MTRKKSSATSLELPEVNFSEDGKIRYLHLGTEWIQGSMFLDRPFDIELEYVQRMFGWLLFFPHDEVKGAHAMQLGLGAGTITKFCYKKLKMTCTAVELNPGVLQACRGWFRLPPDDERLRVVLADASRRTNGAALWMRCRSICTTKRPPLRCWTRLTSIAIAASC
jgi:spermidine synthase